MLASKKEFTGGVALLVVFFAVLVMMFQPMFNGKNAMAYLDDLYNSISKGSVNYVPGLEAEAEKFKDTNLDVTLTFAGATVAKQAATLFEKSGARVSLDDRALAVSGSLGGVLAAVLADAESMYHNNDAALVERYGLPGPRALFDWWTGLKLMDKELKAQGRFEEAKFTATVQQKAVETAYNYFGVEPVAIMDKIGVVIFSLVFYIVYTLWYGFAILFVFEGWGLKLSH